MRGRSTIAAMATVVAVAATGAAACANPFGRQYEYEEQLYLETDGSATVVINASLASLVALRNLPVDPETSPDRETVQAWFESWGCSGVESGRPWTRHGRYFVGVTIEVAHVKDLASCRPLAWSTYAFTRTDEAITYEQRIGGPDRGDAGRVNWDGSEFVGFKLHAPSRVLYHDVRRYEDNEPGETSRGNILTWEQRLTDRLEGRPLPMHARLGPDSILHRTLWLFGGAFATALGLVALLVWLAVRRARRRVRLKPNLS
jgi:hypothetical protein